MLLSMVYQLHSVVNSAPTYAVTSAREKVLISAITVLDRNTEITQIVAVWMGTTILLLIHPISPLINAYDALNRDVNIVSLLLPFALSVLE